jgi:hypothetical protein
MKDEIVNNIILNSKAEMMRSWDGNNYGGITCVNHINRKAKYILKSALSDDE